MITPPRPCLVVIEDNPSDVQLLRFTLEDAGLDCDLTHLVDGLQGLAWVRLHAGSAEQPKPDIIILDLNLPRHDGIEILEAMQNVDGLAKVPVLVLSSSPSPRDEAKVKAFPNARYMTKPADLDGYGVLASVLRQMMA